MARADADRSFERLYVQHRRDVFGAALRELGNFHDAEDVTQAAFIDAYRAILRGSRPESPRAWLLAIGENVRRRRFRTALRRPREEPLEAEVVTTGDVENEQANALRAALAALPPQQRDVFVLREISGLSYEEIAERLGSTVSAVQMLLFRARKVLRARLEPPAVAPRRSLVPVWLTQFLSRGDAVSYTPRGVGVVGAAVLAVGGAAVGVAESQQGPPSRVVVPAAARPGFVSHVSTPAVPSTEVAEDGRPPRATAPARPERRHEAQPTSRRGIRPETAQARPGDTGTPAGAAGAAPPEARPAPSDAGAGEPVLPSSPKVAPPSTQPRASDAVPVVPVPASTLPLPVEPLPAEPLAAPALPIPAPVPPVSAPVPPVAVPAPPVSVPVPPLQPPTPPAVPPPPVSASPPVPLPPVPLPPVPEPVPPVPLP
jgi:RNA polymerase sigma factor (sigma-70 family)